MAADRRISRIFSLAPVSSGIILLLLTTSGLGIVALVILAAIWAGTESDAAALDRQRSLVNSRLLNQVERVSHEVRLMNAGLDTLLRAHENKSRFDTPPAEFAKQIPDEPAPVATFREIATSLFGYDAAFVVALDGTMPFDKDPSVLRRFKWVRPLLQPMMEDLQGELRTSKRSEWSTLKNVPNRAALLRLEGRPAVAGVIPVGSELQSASAAMALKPLDGLYLVAFRFLDGHTLDTLSREQGLSGTRYARAADQEADEVAFQIEATSSREPIGFIIWKPDLPGSRVIGRLAPVLTVAAVIFLALFLALLVSLRRSMKKLSESELYARHLANHDVLTGLPNRAMFNERLNQCLSGDNSGSSPSRTALALIDLDRFKQVNDEHGHPAGDELLLQVVQRIKAVIDADHLFARLGGDEFALLLSCSASSRDPQLKTCQTIVEVLNRPFSLKQSTVSVNIGCSIGIVHAADAKFNQAEMLRCGDVALYEAKTQGRGRLIVYDGRMDLEVQERENLRSDLQALLQALGAEKSPPGGWPEFGRLKLYLQGVHAADTSGRLTGAEALVRWQHPQHGLLTPNRFIQIAEDSGLINELGDWILREATMVAATWPDGLTIAVNVSPTQLRSRSFASGVADILTKAGLAPERLELEVTEAALLDPDEIITANLKALRSMGVRIALDDFGTGFSSLSHLINFEVDRIKIDKSFVNLIGTRAEGTAIISALIGLSQSLGKAVTAEGVETIGQRDFLTALGWADLQGFLLSKPVPSEHFRDGGRGAGISVDPSL